MSDNERVLWTRYFAYAVTTPAGTPIDAPQTTTLDVEDTILDSVELRIPDGHAGLTGWAIDYAEARILPWSSPDAWVRGDDDLLTFRVGFNITGSVNVVTYNLGVFDHTHIFRLQQSYRRAGPGSTLAPMAVVVAPSMS